MNKFIIVSVLLSGIAIGWLLRANTEQNPVVVLQSPPLLDNGLHEPDIIIVPPTPTEDEHTEVINTSVKQPLSPLTELLTAERDAEAIEWFISFERNHGDVASARNLINQQAKKREQQNDLLGAADLLSLLIEELPHGFDERIALAAIYQRQQQFYRALRMLFDTFPIATTSDELSQLDQVIEQVVKATDSAIAAEDITAKIKLYEFLIQHRASYTQYYIELARWLVEGAYLDAAIEQLNIVQYDPFVGNVAQQMLIEIEAQRLKLLEVPVRLTRKGSHFLVDAALNHSDVRLLIDTGASLTVLDITAAQQLGLNDSDVIQRMQMNTANGVTEALLYRIDSMALGVFAVSPIDIAVVEELEISGASGLLGMNFLEHFEFRIDQSEAQLFLKYRD